MANGYEKIPPRELFIYGAFRCAPVVSSGADLPCMRLSLPRWHGCSLVEEYASDSSRGAPLLPSVPHRLLNVNTNGTWEATMCSSASKCPGRGPGHGPSRQPVPSGRLLRFIYCLPLSLLG